MHRLVYSLPNLLTVTMKNLPAPSINVTAPKFTPQLDSLLIYTGMDGS